MKSILLLAALCGSFLLNASAIAEQKAIPMPADNRLVVYPYDPNDTYPVLTIPGSATHIELEPGEEVQAFALGDSIQWKVEKNRNNVFIRPLRPNAFTSATMVTNRRTYQLTFRSSPPGGNWYQRVNWQYPDMIVFDADTAPRPMEQKMPLQQPQAGFSGIGGAGMPGSMNPRDMPITDLSPGVRPATSTADIINNLNFDYKITGEADFRPNEVFDDGTFTYVKLPLKTRQMPALFVKGPTGTYDLINYTIQDRTLKVQGIFSTAVLKIGETEVEISSVAPTVTPPPKKSSSGFFGLFGGGS